ncbi:hypothetical protein [Dendrosporobacter sp. 1207_IL3150]|uniref:hypothetical protein n=1 Tax=Dendrosporobacter sp. 1207_IL3150 TaxID=3084054 RepID=UPI002FD8D899
MSLLTMIKRHRLLTSSIVKALYHHIHSPKNVVRFFLEKESERGKNAPREIEYAPERDLAIALSEYAPGGFVTIGKKIYKCGGIYANRAVSLGISLSVKQGMHI